MCCFYSGSIVTSPLFLDIFSLIKHLFLYLSINQKDKSTLSDDKLSGLEEIVGEEIDAKLIIKAAKSSMGMDTSPQDMLNIHIFTERMISLAQYRKEVLLLSLLFLLLFNKKIKNYPSYSFLVVIYLFRRKDGCCCSKSFNSYWRSCCCSSYSKSWITYLISKMSCFNCSNSWCRKSTL